MAILALVMLGACSEESADEPTSPNPSASPASETTSTSALQLVIIGDSIALGETCLGCTTYPEQLAEAMAESLDADVEIDNLSVGGAEVADLVGQIRDDPAARTSVADADAVVVTVGHNDLAYNRLDDPCGVAPQYPRIDWSSITHECVDEATREYETDLDALIDEVAELRAGQPTMLRITTVYNSVIGDEVDPTWDSPSAVEPSMYAVERMVAVQCQVAKRHDGTCANTYLALNGSDGKESAQPFLNDADATHLAQRGENAFATTLIELGFSPLET